MSRKPHQILFELMRGHRLRYSAAILAMAVSNVFLFAPPLISRAAIDGALAGGGVSDTPAGRVLMAIAGTDSSVRLLAVAALLMVLSTAAGGVFLYLRGRYAATASEAIVRRLRNRIAAHLDRLPCAYHDRAETGDLVQRASSDVETFRVFLAGQIVEIGRTVLLFLTVLPILVALDAPLALVAVSLFPLIVGFALFFFRRIQRLFLLTDEAEGEMTSVLQENLTGIRVVRAFARQEFEVEKFAARNAEFRDRNYRLIRLLAYYWGSSDFVCLTQVGLVLGVGASRVLSGAITVGTLFAFLAYTGMVLWPVRHLGRVLTDTGKALVALKRIGEILDVPEEDAKDAVRDLRDLPALRGAIEFRGVTFAHADAEPALRGVTFRVEPGETVAFVGPPGCGKSTLIHLLLRLYDVPAGMIHVDGIDLLEWPRGPLRSQIGVVLQEPFLYSRTIGANVRLGRKEATLEEVVEATSAADVHGAIMDFERGYETLLGERGVTLSGGQRQRVAIARAILKDPPLLVLDDALSAVDTVTESRILRALESRRGRQTTIVVSHRLSSVRHADRIVVLDHGRVVQQGTHTELAATEGPYRRLWEIQSELEDEIASDVRDATGGRA
ncbi:MAG: ABC transporter ATP-binding protein [bacterium]